MGGLEDVDRRKIREFGRRVSQLELDGLTGIARALEELRRLVGAEQLAMWGFDETSAGLRLTFSLMVARDDAGAAVHELKATLGDQPMRSWVVAYQSEPFTARQTALLEAASAPLAERIASIQLRLLGSG